MMDSFLRPAWNRLRTNWRYRVAVSVFLVFVVVVLAGVGAAFDGPPDSHVETVGVVQSVRSDQTTNSESGRITTWWTKEILVVDGDRRTWTVAVRDRHEYAVDDQITVSYDPDNPAETLVTEDHVFHPAVQIVAVVGVGVVFVLLTIVIGLSVASALRRNRPAAR